MQDVEMDDSKIGESSMPKTLMYKILILFIKLRRVGEDSHLFANTMLLQDSFLSVIFSLQSSVILARTLPQKKTHSLAADSANRKSTLCTMREKRPRPIKRRALSSGCRNAMQVAPFSLL
jgi:hypothetical protein